MLTRILRYLTIFLKGQKKYFAQAVALAWTFFLAGTVAHGQTKQEIDSLFKYADYVLSAKVMNDVHTGNYVNLGGEKCFVTIVPVFWFKVTDSIVGARYDTVKLDHDFLSWDHYKKLPPYHGHRSRKKGYKKEILTFSKDREFIFFLKRSKNTHTLTTDFDKEQKDHYSIYCYSSSLFAHEGIYYKGAFEFTRRIKRMEQFPRRTNYDKAQ